MIKNCRKLAKYWFLSLILGLFSAMGVGTIGISKISGLLNGANLAQTSIVNNTSITQSSGLLDFSSV